MERTVEHEIKCISSPEFDQHVDVGFGSRKETLSETLAVASVDARR